MKNLQSLLLQICVLTLLAGVARGDTVRTSGLIAENTDWENPYYIIDSGAQGPTLLVTAGLESLVQQAVAWVAGGVK